GGVPTSGLAGLTTSQVAAVTATTAQPARTRRTLPMSCHEQGLCRFPTTRSQGNSEACPGRCLVQELGLLEYAADNATVVASAWLVVSLRGHPFRVGRRPLA